MFNRTNHAARNESKVSPSRSLFSFLLTAVIALAGGLLFTLLHIPIPWLLGPMLFVFLFSRFRLRMDLSWPGAVRNTGMIIVGYSIGLSFTATAAAQIGGQLPTMILMTTLLLLYCTGIACVIAKVCGIPFATALTGSIPGGLTQMVALAEETDDIDLTVVAFLQVSRLMMIILIIPLLIFSPLFAEATHRTADLLLQGGTWSGIVPEVIPYAIACTAAALIGRRYRFPTAYMLCPLLVTACANLAGWQGPPLPSAILAAAQFMIGGYVGLLLKPEQLEKKLKLIVIALASGLVLIAGSLGLSWMLLKLHPAISKATSFLSLSPGGMDQMGIIAHEVGAELAIVTCYQLFRTLFIFLAVPPLLRMIFTRLRRHTKVKPQL